MRSRVIAESLSGAIPVLGHHMHAKAQVACRRPLTSEPVELLLGLPLNGRPLVLFIVGLVPRLLPEHGQSYDMATVAAGDSRSDAQRLGRVRGAIPAHQDPPERAPHQRLSPVG